MFKFKLLYFIAKSWAYGLLAIFIWADLQIGNVFTKNPEVSELQTAKIHLSSRLIWLTIIIAGTESLENMVKVWNLRK